MCNIVVLVRWALERKRKRRRRRERRRVSCNKWPFLSQTPPCSLARQFTYPTACGGAATSAHHHPEAGVSVRSGFPTVAIRRQAGGSKEEAHITSNSAALKAGERGGKDSAKGPYSSPVTHTCMSRREASGRAVPCVQSRAKARRDSETARRRQRENRWEGRRSRLVALVGHSEGTRSGEEQVMSGRAAMGESER